MTRWLVFETLTGRVLAEFTPQTGKWTERLNEPETVDVTIALSDPEEASREWRSLATPWKHSLAVEESGRLFGGPIQPHDYDDDGAVLKLTARGIRSYFSRRTVLPPAALFTALVRADGSPEDALDTRIRDVDLGTIGKKLVQQACAWEGAGLPIEFEPDRPGSRERTYVAIDLKTVGESLNQLSGVAGGPDFSFTLRWKNDTSLEWIMRSGTETAPKLSSPEPLVWDLSAENTGGVGLSVKTDPSKLGSLAWVTGGRSDDRILISRGFDRDRVDDGTPLLELVDTSHTSVSDQATLDGWARALLQTGSRPAEFRSFRASLVTPPWLSEYRVGDYCELVVGEGPYTPASVYTHRILELSGNDAGDWVDVTLGEVFDD